ncbi:MBL fold metallo-hydrolase [Pseudonocardia halophobica]|uniref:MBL fold metallo-hydrolase n=1 Tax=Pseudonocardia halophobica TaxID=29401 RepID=UPI0018CC6B9B|nr:MBL fold metallo-hydrolase [Pseudonocardia halophobica]
MQTWSVGEFTITKVVELSVEVGLLDGLIAEATPEVVKSVGWLCPDFAIEDGRTLWDVNSFVVDTGDAVVMVDAGCGNGKSFPMQPVWDTLDTPFLEGLAGAGYRPEDVDVVLLTHLHLDHVGWCATRDAAGRWVPTFPNAEVWVVREEYEAFRDPAEVEWVDSAALQAQRELMYQQSIRPVEEAGLLRIVPADAPVAPGIRLYATPGHTEGHHSVLVESDGASAFVTGDFIHHPIQIAFPDWSSRVDVDPAESATRRRALFEWCAGTDLVLLGTHFSGPGGGRVVQDGEGYRLVPVGASHLDADS